MLSEVPEGWSFTAFDEAAKLQSGFPFKSASFSDDKTVGYPLIRIRDLLKQDPSKFVNEEVLPEFIISKGDVLIGMDGEFNCVEWQTRDAALNQRVLKVMETNLSHRKFLLYLLQPLLTELEKSISGTTVKHLSTRDLRRLDLLLPPLPEQKRIAEILSSVDESIQATQSVIDQAEGVKRGLMEDLLTGGLGSEAIARGEVPDGWHEFRLEYLSHFITKGATPTTYGFGWEQSGIPFFRSECVSENGFIESGMAFISEKAHAKLSRSIVKANDLLISITGNVGRVAIVPKCFYEANINQHIARVRINSEEVDTAFVYQVLSSHFQRQKFASIVTGQAYPQLSLRQIRETALISPPLPEQKRIAEILSSVDEFIQSQKQIIDQYQVTKKGLMDDLLTGKVRTV